MAISTTDKQKNQAYENQKIYQAYGVSKFEIYDANSNGVLETERGHSLERKRRSNQNHDFINRYLLWCATDISLKEMFQIPVHLYT